MRFLRYGPFTLLRFFPITDVGGTLKRRISAISYILAFLLTIATAGILVSLLQVVDGQAGFLTVPGRFLFETFLWSSFFIPLYLFILALFLLSPSFSGRGLLVLNLFILPFITASVFHKVVLHGRIPPSFLPDLMVKNLRQARRPVHSN